MAAGISPQPLAVGETNHNTIESLTISKQKQSYAAQLQPKQSAVSKVKLFPFAVVHGEPTIEFTMDEVNEFTREEGLHQAVVVKFSYGKPELQEIRIFFTAQFDFQGRCNIGLLEYRHLLVRFDLYNDYVKFLSRSTGYMKSKGDDFFFRTFPWTIGFNPKEETSMAVVWISLPCLPPNFFAKRSLLSIASAVGKSLAVDKATQERTRPSAARVKVILDLMDKHPKKVKIVMMDKFTGKSIVHDQVVVYDNLPSYCTYCKHQGHEEKVCRVMKRQAEEEVLAKDTPTGGNLPNSEVSMIEQLQGDARDYLNAKRAEQRGKDGAPTDGNLIGEAEKNKLVVQQRLQNEGGKETANESNANLLIRATDGNAVGDSRMLNKLPPESMRDVPARQALARIFDAVNPVVAGYDKLKRCTGVIEAKEQGILDTNDATAMSTDGCQNIGSDRPNEPVQIGNTKEINADGDRGQKTGQFAATVDTHDGKSQAFGGKTGINKDEILEDKAGHVRSDIKGEDLKKKGEVWNVVAARNSPTKRVVSPTQKSAASRPNDFNIPSSSNCFDALVAVEDDALVSTTSQDDRVNKQIVPVANNEKEVHVNENLAKVKLGAELAHSSNAPTLHFSNPHIEQIIKDAQNAMMMKSTMFKQPVVALNTSVFEVPTLSVESMGEFKGESGQRVLSTGNNNDVIHANVRGMAIKSKLWADQREEDDEEDWGDGFAGYSSEEADHDDGEDSAGSLALSKPVGTPATSHKSNLNVNAPVFLPKNSPNRSLTPAASTKIEHTVPVATDRTTSIIKSGQQQIKVPSPVLDAVQQQLMPNESATVCIADRTETTAKSEQQLIGKNPTASGENDRHRAVLNPKEQLPGVPAISEEERNLLDAMVNYKPAIFLNHNALSTGQVNKNRKKVKDIELKQTNKALANKHDTKALMTQGIERDMPNPVKLGREIYEEGEEDEYKYISSRGSKQR